ncbi:MAG: hypothetical protein ACO3U1_07160 [Marivivens sp.]
MQIVYHIGANCTDDDRLLKSLLKNVDAFAAEGIKVPGPGKYRRIIRETIQNLNGAQPSPDTRDILLDTILYDEAVNRLIMSHSAFICIPNHIFADGVFYGRADAKIAGLVSLFPDDEIEMFLGIRNPATFVPAVFKQAKHSNFAQFLSGIPLDQIRWSDVVERIQEAAPKASWTVWCNEDTPLIWSQLIREISGVDPLAKITGGFDLLASIMAPEGMKRFFDYLKSHPPATEIQKRRIIAAFLERYVIEAEVIEEFDLPGWTAEVVNHLTEAYEEDIYRISRMPGVNFIAP